jgi:hypothetical protein
MFGYILGDSETPPPFPGDYSASKLAANRSSHRRQLYRLTFQFTVDVFSMICAHYAYEVLVQQLALASMVPVSEPQEDKW